MVIETKILRVDSRNFHFTPSNTDGDNDDSLAHIRTADLEPLPASDQHAINHASTLLLNGDVVAIPTETVYGLAANALDATAVQRIFDAKSRPSDNPLIIHVASLNQLERLCGPIPPVYEPLIARYWPGPLTILLHRPACIPRIVCGEVDTVAVRMPSHPVARALISVSGVPLAAPSANRSGRPSPTTAQHVYTDLVGCIPLIIGMVDDDGCDVGVESTVLDALSCPPVVLRPGGVTLEQIRAIPGFEHTRMHTQSNLTNDDLDALVPSTPGMKYRHYAPDTALVVVVDTMPHLCAVERDMKQLLKSDTQLKRFAWVHLVESMSEPVSIYTQSIDADDEATLVHYRIRGGPEELARELFGAFRHLEALQVDVIYVQSVSETGVGAAVMNRMRKASSRSI